MSLTPTASTTAGSSLKAPDAVVSVSTGGAASSSGNTFTTTSPKVLYTAPSDCVSAKIYFSKSIDHDKVSFMESYASINNYFYALEILNGTTTREIIRGGRSNQTIWFNFLDTSVLIPYGSSVLLENDTLVGMNGVAQISGNTFTLGPGESLQLQTFHNNNNREYLFNFQAWVYN